MLDVLHAIGLDTLLINVDQGEIKWIIDMDKEMLYVTIATNLATLQCSAEARMWIEKVQQTKTRVCR